MTQRGNVRAPAHQLLPFLLLCRSPIPIPHGQSCHVAFVLATLSLFGLPVALPVLSLYILFGCGGSEMIAV